MARRSQADLTVVPLILEGARPRPPAELDELERSIWTAIGDASPAHVIDAAAQQILRRLVAQAAVAERLEVRLRELRALGQDPWRGREAFEDWGRKGRVGNERTRPLRLSAKSFTTHCRKTAAFLGVRSP